VTEEKGPHPADRERRSPNALPIRKKTKRKNTSRPPNKGREGGRHNGEGLKENSNGGNCRKRGGAKERKKPVLFFLPEKEGKKKRKGGLDRKDVYIPSPLGKEEKKGQKGGGGLTGDETCCCASPEKRSKAGQQTAPHKKKERQAGKFGNLYYNMLL